MNIVSNVLVKRKKVKPEKRVGYIFLLHETMEILFDKFIIKVLSLHR